MFALVLFVVLCVLVALMALSCLLINKRRPAPPPIEQESAMGYEAPYPSPMRELTAEECHQVSAETAFFQQMNTGEM